MSQRNMSSLKSTFVRDQTLLYCRWPSSLAVRGAFADIRSRLDASSLITALDWNLVVVS